MGANPVSDPDMRERLNSYQGCNLDEASAIKKQITIPVICTGGFQQASYIRKAIEGGHCDAVSMARPLIANHDLPKIFAQGKDLPDRPCTYCNKCLVYAIAYPLGCYEVARYDGDYDKMIEEIMSVFDPPGVWA
jgi:2,4-dienoyl-CoA reductase (NADPH2)